MKLDDLCRTIGAKSFEAGMVVVCMNSGGKALTNGRMYTVKNVNHDDGAIAIKHGGYFHSTRFRKAK